MCPRICTGQMPSAERSIARTQGLAHIRVRTDYVGCPLAAETDSHPRPEPRCAGRQDLHLLQLEIGSMPQRHVHPAEVLRISRRRRHALITFSSCPRFPCEEMRESRRLRPQGHTSWKASTANCPRMRTVLYIDSSVGEMTSLMSLGLELLRVSGN